MSAETPRSPVVDSAVGAAVASAAIATERLPRAFGKFALKRRLARGGMADVFLASLSGAQGFEKELVVKLIRPELAADEGFVRRFVDEAKTCVKLTHPNIVSIFELGVETGVLYLAMELVRGATLAEMLHEGGALAPEEGAFVALEVARALDHAHRRGVIHRDVTPGNVMIDDEGSVKLLDFGIAAPAGLDVEVFGTPGHMPPEQIEGGALTAAVDLFALGTVMLEAWTGRAPYRRAEARASRTALLEGPPPKPSNSVPALEELDELTLALLARSARERPQHADDVARTLRRWLRERNADLDEVARALAKRVTRATHARDAREAGRHVPAGPMARTMRPTPLADATRTFATRGELTSWRGPATRRLDEVEGDSRSPSVEPSSTRRIEPVDDDAPKLQSLARPPGGSPRTLIVALVVASLVALLAATAWSLAHGVPASDHAMPMPSSASGTAAVSASASSAIATATVASTSPASGSTSTTVPTPSTGASSTAVASTAPPSAALTARLIVTSSPPSNVELDGRPAGSTPLSLTASLGDHRVVLRPVGLGESFERKVTLSATSGAEVHGDFNDEPQISVRRLAAAPQSSLGAMSSSPAGVAASRAP